MGKKENGNDVIDAKPALKPATISIGKFRISLAVAGLACMIIGLLLFAAQYLSDDKPAYPHKIIGKLIFHNFPPEDEASAEQTETPPAAETPQPNELRVPQSLSHYDGRPRDNFREQYDGFMQALQLPQDLIALPVNIRLVKDTAICVRGAERKADENAGLNAEYYVTTMSPDSATRLLGSMSSRPVLGDGDYAIGPWLYGGIKGDLELELPEGSVVPLLRLSEEASALQGNILTTSEEVEPNAAFLIAKDGVTASAFIEAYKALNKTLAKYYEDNTVDGKGPDFVPVPWFSDYRHDAAVYFTTITGQTLFLIGSFVLLFVLFHRLAQKPRGGQTLLIRLILEGCELISTHRLIYAVSIAIFMAFWFGGMVSAYLDPAGKDMLVRYITGLLSSSGGTLGLAGQAYGSGNIFAAALVTFLVNLIQGTLMVITLPSLIPLATGAVFNAVRGLFLSLALAPTHLFTGKMILPHLITEVLELQAYLLAAFVSVLMPIGVIKPKMFGFDTRKEAFTHFAWWQFRIIPLVVAFLLIAALYEAVEIIVMTSLL